MPDDCTPGADPPPPPWAGLEDLDHLLRQLTAQMRAEEERAWTALVNPTAPARPREHSLPPQRVEHWTYITERHPALGRRWAVLTDFLPVAEVCAWLEAHPPTVGELYRLVTEPQPAQWPPAPLEFLGTGTARIILSRTGWKLQTRWTTL